MEINRFHSVTPYVYTYTTACTINMSGSITQVLVLHKIRKYHIQIYIMLHTWGSGGIMLHKWGSRGIMLHKRGSRGIIKRILKIIVCIIKNIVI